MPTEPLTLAEIEEAGRLAEWVICPDLSGDDSAMAGDLMPRVVAELLRLRADGERLDKLLEYIATLSLLPVDFRTRAEQAIVKIGAEIQSAQGDEDG